VPHTVPCSPQRVLIVDDNRDLADSLGMVLCLCGHCVEVAYCGEDAISKARSFSPDVVVCDLGMPRLDGCDVARTFRADPLLRRVRLIALTACHREEEARVAGFDHYLIKPPNLRQLARLLAD